jgi:hypothetical protein
MLGTRAYPVGEDVVIGESSTDPHMLAHELTHVLQQRQGPVAGTDHGDGLRVSDPSDRFERDAEDNARCAMSGPFPAFGKTWRLFATLIAVATTIILLVAAGTLVEPS